MELLLECSDRRGRLGKGGGDICSDSLVLSLVFLKVAAAAAAAAVVEEEGAKMEEQSLERVTKKHLGIGMLLRSRSE